MKSIVYIIILSLAGASLFSAMPLRTTQASETLQFQCSNENFSEIGFAKAEQIINRRLNQYGVKNFTVDGNNLKGSFKISFNSGNDPKVIEKLVMTRGQLGFYETHDRMIAIKQLRPDDFLYSILNIPRKKKERAFLESNALFGFSKGDNRTEIEEYLKYKARDGLLFPGIKFSWSIEPIKNDSYKLFLLKEEVVLGNKDVAEVSAIPNEQDNFDISISFTDAASKIWQELTGNNTGNAIAIMVDGHVYSAPVVKEEMSGGKCLISGNFNEQEAKLLVSIMGNEALPLDFKLVE